MIISREKKKNPFFSIVQGSAKKITWKKKHYQSAILFTDTHKYETAITYIYKSAVAITSPLALVRSGEENVNSQNRPKKFSIQNICFHVYLGTMAKLFTRKNLTSPLFLITVNNYETYFSWTINIKLYSFLGFYLILNPMFIETAVIYIYIWLNTSLPHREISKVYSIFLKRVLVIQYFFIQRTG